MPQDKIILAIDGLNIKQAKSFLKICPGIRWVKVGLELFSREGPEAIKILKQMDKKVFLDLKFYDIPNTMGSACYQVSKLGVDIISLHASAGLKALRISKDASIEGAKEMNHNPPSIVGVTVLTSFSSKEFQNETNFSTTIEENVLRLAKTSFNAGLDGCVCSPWEIEKLRIFYDKDFQLITPGIRLNSDPKNDQARTMTPLQALKKGASKLVIGRSITKSNNPDKTFIDICKGIN